MNQKITLLVDLKRREEEGHLNKGGRHMLIIYPSSTNHVSSLVALAPCTRTYSPSLSPLYLTSNV
jgi:hypothetical protein